MISNKSIFRSLFSIRSVVLIVVSVLTVLIFQNCGTGFKQQQESLASGLDQTSQSGFTPAIVTPMNPSLIGVNMATKIPVTTVDADSPANTLEIIVRQAPLNGKLTVEDSSVTTNRGVVYSPKSDFRGSDSFVIAVRDAQGHQSQDVRYDVNVEAKGIGQMIGDFAHDKCVPTTAPHLSLYKSTATQFSFVQRMYSVDCSVEIFLLRMEGSHSIGQENVPVGNGGPNGFEYNITGASITITPLSAMGVMAMNQQNYCGFNNWVMGVAKNLGVSGCNGIWGSSTLYMYRAVEYPPGFRPRLYISNLLGGGDGKSPQTRTQGVNTSFFLYKLEDIP